MALSAALHSDSLRRLRRIGPRERLIDSWFEHLGGGGKIRQKSILPRSAKWGNRVTAKICRRRDGGSRVYDLSCEKANMGPSLLLRAGEGVSKYSLAICRRGGRWPLADANVPRKTACANTPVSSSSLPIVLSFARSVVHNEMVPTYYEAPFLLHIAI